MRASWAGEDPSSTRPLLAPGNEDSLIVISSSPPAVGAQRQQSWLEGLFAGPSVDRRCDSRSISCQAQNEPRHDTPVEVSVGRDDRHRRRGFPRSHGFGGYSLGGSAPLVGH